MPLTQTPQTPTSPSLPRAAAALLLLLGLAAAPAVLAAPQAQPAAKRPLQVDDIYNLKQVDHPRLSPDGAWVAFEVERRDAKRDKPDSDVWMAPYGGGEAVRVTTAEENEGNPEWSPDGRWLAFLSSRGGSKKTQVWLLDRRGGEAFKLTDYKADVSDLAWSPDGKRLALVVADVDPDDPDFKEKKEGEEEEATKPIVITRRQFKRDGEGYLTNLHEHIHVFDVAARKGEQVTAGAYDDSEPAWSPDGRWIAFTSNRTADPDANQNTDVFVVAPEKGAEPRRLSTSDAADSAPSWSPDGRSLVYVQGSDPADLWYGPSAVAVVPAAGGPARLLTAALDRNVERPRFAPDGGSVLFLVEDGGNRQLARVPAAGGGGGKIERVVAGERDISDFDLGPKGEIALLAGEPQQPAEVSAVAPGGALRRISRVNDAFLAGIALGEVRRFKAKSKDGTPIDVFLTLPPNASQGVRLPTILRIHGGPASQFSTDFETEWQILAAHGYAVVAANPRGSTGYGRDFSRAIWADWGNKDFEDVMAAVDAAVAMGVADPDRLGVGGWSYGGMLTDYVITKTGRFKAAVTGASETNYLADYGTDHYQYEWETELGLPWRNADLWVRLSPFFQVEKVTTPTLVMCGQEDANVPLLNSEQLYQALRRLGRETELVIYPGQHHSFRRPSYIKDRYERYLAWYDRYLRPAAPQQQKAAAAGAPAAPATAKPPR